VFGALLVTGCARELPGWALPNQSFAQDISQSAPPRVRAQTPEGPTVKPLFPSLEMPKGFGQQSGPKPSVFNPPPAPAGFGVQQTTMSTHGRVRVKVRAWVNGRPIFDDELNQWAGAGLAEADRGGKMIEHFNAKLEDLIDQEVLYQDAVKKLEKVSPHSLDKLREFVDAEFDKTLRNWRENKMPEDVIQIIEPARRRILERNLISSEYARSRIKPMLDTVVNLSQISEYYETHKNEFQTVDRIVWQDIFIPIDANLPTIEHAKQFGEDLITKCLKPGDFDRLMAYNKGDSALRGGEGIGQRRGEIRPAELEATLFSLKEGQIGPVIAFPTGVHLIRVTKKEEGRQLVLDETVQKTIRTKLIEQLYQREYRRIVRELRTRAVVRIERDEP
jgi:parvulin-like peptidyl-prolyl isomerase